MKSYRSPPGTKINLLESLGMRKFLAFRAHDTDFVVDILHVRDVLPYSAPMPVRGLPPVYAGALRCKDMYVPVVELRSSAAAEAADLQTETSILLVNVRGQDVGLVVDGVNGILALTEAQMEPVNDQIDGPSRPYVTCIRGVSHTLALLDWPGSTAL